MPFSYSQSTVQLGRLAPRLAALAFATALSFGSAAARAQQPSPPPPPLPSPTGAAAPADQPPPPPPPLPPSGAYPMPPTPGEAYGPRGVPPTTAPLEIDEWQDGEPIPPGYHRAQRLRKGLIIAGAVTFGTLYVISTFGAAVAHDANEDGSAGNANALYIPAVGPFIQIASTTTATGNYFNVLDGIGQTAGLVMLIVGLTSPRTVLVRNDFGIAALLPTPYVNREGGGLRMVGYF